MKKYLFGAFALVLAVSFSAFTAPSHKFATKFFVYIGTTDIGYANASNWQVSNSPFPDCDGVEKTCTVESTTLTNANQIATYCASHDPQVNNGLIYVIDTHRVAF